MKRFIQSSIETLSIEVGAISEIKVTKSTDEYDCGDKTYKGHIVSQQPTVAQSSLVYTVKSRRHVRSQTQ